MVIRNTVGVVIVLLGTAAGLSWHFGGGAQPHIAMTPEMSRSARPPLPAAPPAPVVAQRMAANPPSEPSIVGLSFELSQSVQDDCRRLPWEPCKELQLFLDRLEAEPRDADWAPDLEARIEKAVMAGERGKFRIRALECRRTRCALEVASEVETIGIEFDSDPGFDEIMWPRMGTFADEDDPQTGIRTIVSVQTWQSSESMLAETAVPE